MRLALLSDIHGNIAGLDAAFAYLRKLGGFDDLFVLGDIGGSIGGAVGTKQVLDLLLQNHAHLIRGNWEELLFDVDALVDRTDNPVHARRTVESCLADLSSAHLNSLKSLAVQQTVELAPGHKLFMCHAAPNDTWSRTCQPDTLTAVLREVYGSLDAEVVTYGHYHGHHVISLDGKLLVNVAGVGIGDGLAAFTLIEYNERWVVRQYQAAYKV